jgi:hypothetical protein
VAPAPDPSNPARTKCERDGGGTGTGWGIGTAGGRTCKGVACLAGTIDHVPHETRTEVGILGDKQAHVAIVDRQTGAISVRKEPRECLSTGVRAIGGLVLLQCIDQLLFTTSRGDDRWHDEGSLPAENAILGFSMAADGTILLHEKCKKRPACRALARSPLAAGAPRAWRTIAVPGAIVYRVAEKGAVLAVGPGDTLSLTVDESGGARRTLVENVIVDDSLNGITVDADGHVVLSWHGGRAWIDLVGKLVPGVPEPRVERDEDGYEIVDATPIEF